MLLAASVFKGYAIESPEGEIGSELNFYFDEKEWQIRFLAPAATIFGREVLIPIQAISSQPDNCGKRLRVSAARETIKNSPAVNTEQPLSRAQQHILDRYYSWHIQQPDEISELPEIPFTDTAAHNSREFLGCGLKTHEGELAAVGDLIIDEEKWAVRYLVLQAGLWLPGKKFLLDAQWIDRIDWTEKRAYADLPAEKIRNSPDYDPATVITAEYERSVQEHFGPPAYSTQKALEEIIRRKAQELYAKRGAGPGNDWADWFEAERLVKEELSRMIEKKARELCKRKGCKPESGRREWFEAERIVQERMRKKR